MKRKIVVAVSLSALALLSCFNLQASTVATAAQSRADIWFNSYIFWAIAHYALGLTSVVLAVLAGTNRVPSASSKAKLALGAALAAATLTFFNPATHAKAYHQAWQGLDSELRKFNEQDTKTKESCLNIAIDNGEKLIKEAGM